MAVKKTVLFLLIILLPSVLEAKDPGKPKADGRLGLKEEMRLKIKTIKNLLDEVSALAEICGACDSNPCLNGGTCLEEAGGKYSCQCAIGWKGDRCDVCHKAIGMEDGTISDGQITASSNEAEHEASRGRLNFEVAPGKPGSWSARFKNSYQWLQVDLGTQHGNTTGLATQGGTNYREKSRWVTRYKLKFSDDGVNFQYYKREGQATDKEFVGNNDLKTVVYHDLNPPISARYIRIEPTAWKLWISMRVEFYGCEEIEPCDGVKCFNGGSCRNIANGTFKCDCLQGYYGQKCELQMGSCDCWRSRSKSPSSSGGWGYGGPTDAIDFQTSGDIILQGYRLWGVKSGSTSFQVTIGLYRGSTLIAQRNGSYPTSSSAKTFEVHFSQGISIRAGVRYRATAKITTSSNSFFLTDGMASTSCSGVTVTFTTSSGNSNGSGVSRGQIPALIFRSSQC